MTTPALITCIGETIVDFVATAPGSLREAGSFLKAAGGAPANVTVGLSRLGSRSAFVGSVGDDPFGRFLVDSLRSEGVDVRGVRFDRERKTRLAFVSLTPSGERDFAFWEKSPADEILKLGPADMRRIARSRIVHVSSFMLLKSSPRATILRLTAQLRRLGILVSFDPNLRLSLWDSRSEARRLIWKMIGLCDIARMNDEEACFITGQQLPGVAGAAILNHGPAIVVITHGEKGCSFFSRKGSGSVPGFSVRAADTTGCGDAFLAALLHGLANQLVHIDLLTADVLHSICRYANAVGALTSLHAGAMAIPSPAAVDQFLREQG